MIKAGKVSCDRCGDRIYKNAFVIENICYCNRCIRELYLKDVKDLVKKDKSK